MLAARPQGMMIGCVSSPAVPDLHPALRPACPARPLAGLQRHRAAGATARGRRAAPHHAQASPGLGRPGGAGRADLAPAQKAAGAPAGHAGHGPAVAPPSGQEEMDLPEPHRTAAAVRPAACAGATSTSTLPLRSSPGSCSNTAAMSCCARSRRPAASGSSRWIAPRWRPCGRTGPASRPSKPGRALATVTAAMCSPA